MTVFVRGAIAVALAIMLLAPPRPATAGEAPLLDPAGLTRLMSEFRGEVVLVNLWATWCRPCLKEIPELMHLEAEYADRGFRLLAISLDEPDAWSVMVEPFRDKWFPDWKTYIRNTDDMDSLVSVIDPAWNEILPTSYLVGRDGNVAEVIWGGKSYEEFEAALKKVL
jgi:thiol-disulfide isomerase/thioredoxin